MGTYATNADVTSRMGYRTIGASTKPSTTDIDGWITDAEGALHGALGGVNVTTPITSTGGIALMKLWVVNYVVGVTKEVYANATGDGSNDFGEKEQEQFWELIENIANNPSQYEEKLSGASSGAGSSTFRSYVLNNNDSKSIANDDFLPVFNKSDGVDQL